MRTPSAARGISFRTGAGLALAVLLLGSAAGRAAAQSGGTAPAASSAQDLKAAIEEIKRRVEQQRQAAGSAPAGPAADDLKAARDRVENLAQTMVQLRAERDNLRAQLLQTRDELGKAQQRQAATDKDQQAAAAAAAAKAAALEKDLAGAKGHADDLAKTSADLTRQRDEAQAAVADREAKLGAAQGEVDRLRQAVAQGEEQQRALAAQADALRARGGELEADLAKAKAEVEESRAEAERRLAAEVDSLKGQLDQARRENADLRSVASSSVEEARRLSDQLLATIAERDRLVAASRELSASPALKDAKLGGNEEADGGSPQPPSPAPAASPAQPPGPARDAAVPAALQLSDNAAEDGPSAWTKTVLEGSLFVPNGDKLGPGAPQALARVAQLVRESKGDVRIVGHTDASADAEQSRALSLRRAQSVRDYLVRTFGFDQARFKVDGKGADQPLAPNDNAAGRKANRRVEVYVAQ
jgi:outer membrane protein OmpA-like peptidoglycan-associated protein